MIRQGQPDYDWGRHRWARGYTVKSSEYVTDEVWQEYVANWKPLEPKDDFHVV
jgi:REP element-mobilizing transposase RayT